MKRICLCGFEGRIFFENKRECRRLDSDMGLAGCAFCGTLQNKIICDWSEPNETVYAGGSVLRRGKN